MGKKGWVLLMGTASAFILVDSFCARRREDPKREGPCSRSPKNERIPPHVSNVGDDNDLHGDGSLGRPRFS